MSPLFVREGLRYLGKFNRRLPKLVGELHNLVQLEVLFAVGGLIRTTSRAFRVGSK